MRIRSYLNDPNRPTHNKQSQENPYERAGHLRTGSLPSAEEEGNGRESQDYRCSVTPTICKGEEMNKQLKALYETEEMLEQEWENGNETHHWDEHTCPLCLNFKLCRKCPFGIIDRLRGGDGVEGCTTFRSDYGYAPTLHTPIDETLSIIISMIQYYEKQ